MKGPRPHLLGLLAEDETSESTCPDGAMHVSSARDQALLWAGVRSRYDVAGQWWRQALSLSCIRDSEH